MKGTEASGLFYLTRKTPFGPVAVLWSRVASQPKIRRVFLSRSDLSTMKHLHASFPSSVTSSCAEVDALADKIVAFLMGDDIRFSLDIARLDLCSEFQRKVLRAEHRIPRGRVTTYKRIATQIANARAARAVGTALAKNPFPIIIPCHRAIRSDGTIGDYQGGTEMKRALLEMEGVGFDDAGRLTTREFFY